ncbi:hypothetical protein [Aquitalea sp.]|uniref:hypothetical protein n=1 Tax=Aquitalea sp. TaxID=1872623 RepID=UPI00258C74E5|nr:hypothetical protein [Aquitalea sp.]
MSNPWLALKAGNWQKTGCHDANNGSRMVNAANLALPPPGLIAHSSHAYHLFMLDREIRQNGAISQSQNTNSRQ